MLVVMCRYSRALYIQQVTSAESAWQATICITASTLVHVDSMLEAMVLSALIEGCHARLLAHLYSWPEANMTSIETRLISRHHAGPRC